MTTTTDEPTKPRLSLVGAASIREVTVGQVTERLSNRFPGSSRRHINDVVGEEYDLLEGHPIRMYVPNLVEHEARERLRQTA